MCECVCVSCVFRVFSCELESFARSNQPGAKSSRNRFRGRSRAGVLGKERLRAGWNGSVQQVGLLLIHKEDPTGIGVTYRPIRSLNLCCRLYRLFEPFSSGSGWAALRRVSKMALRL